MLNKDTLTKTFVNNAVNHTGSCESLPLGAYPSFSLQRIAVYVETQKELDKKLRDIPGGNLDHIRKIQSALDEAITYELKLANSHSNLDADDSPQNNIEAVGKELSKRIEEACRKIALNRDFTRRG